MRAFYLRGFLKLVLTDDNEGLFSKIGGPF
jgi:hypothetical protein